jgi:hypothetical protein
MSNRASSSQLAPPSAASSSKRFANRRQERVRGAGKHEIIPRKYNFGQPRSSSLTSSTSTTPAQQGRQSSTQGTSVSSTPLNRNESRASSTPAMSVRSGRVGLIPSSSPSKYIDPRLLADQSHHLLNGDMLLMPSPSVNGRLVESIIDKHRSERLRGAGTHKIEPRLIQFGNGRISDASDSDLSQQISREMEAATASDQRRQERLRGAGTHQIEKASVQFVRGRPSDATSSDSGIGIRSSPGLLDRVMERMSQSPMAPSVENGGNYLDQRRMERRRGAGGHAIQEVKATFGPLNGRSDTPSSVLDSGSNAEEDEDDHGNRTVTGRFSPPSESTPRGISGQTQSFPSFDNKMDLDDQDDGQSHTMQSPGSMAAQRIMDKRKSKRQGSPLSDIQRKNKSARRAGSKKGPPRRIVDLGMLNEADETIAGQADETLQEQREAAFTAPEPPSWTFPKNPVTKEELSAMKSRVQEMMTLALGNEAGAVRTVKVNDADVLWSVLKKEVHSEQQKYRPNSTTSTLLDQLSDSLLSTFTHLSQQSAERSQLIHHLIQARRRNLHLRKQVFQKRSQVLKVARAMQVLKTQELKRVQEEEEEERSLHFLSELQKVSHEWT